MTLSERITALSGDDHRIIRHCAGRTQLQFFMIGLCVPVIYLLGMVSTYVTFRHVFDSYFLSMLLALFFSWMIINMYRLLLYTISADPLPHKRAAYGTRRSLLLRVAFICFIAFMIAKPFESLFYAGELDREIELYKTAIERKNTEKIRFYYAAQIDEIRRIVKDEERREIMMAEKESERQVAILKANQLIYSSGFYLQRLCFLNLYHPSCWLITLFFMFVFLYPVWLKYRLGKSDYYELKGVAEKRKIDLNYYAFRKLYASFFEKNYNKSVVYSEPYSDAPYNTIRKEDGRRFLAKNDLISEIYNHA